MADSRELEESNPENLEQEDAAPPALAIQAKSNVPSVSPLRECIRKKVLEAKKAKTLHLKKERTEMKRRKEAAEFAAVTASMVAKIEELGKERDSALARARLAECAHESVFGLKKEVEISLECEKLNVENLMQEKAEVLRRLAQQMKEEHRNVRRLENDNMAMVIRLSKHEQCGSVVSRQTGSPLERGRRQKGRGNAFFTAEGVEGRCEERDAVDANQLPPHSVEAQLQRLWDRCEVLKIEAAVEASKNRELGGRLVIVTTQNDILKGMCQKQEEEYMAQSEARASAEWNAERAIDIMTRMRDLIMARAQEGTWHPVGVLPLQLEELFSEVDGFEIKVLGSSRRERKRACTFSHDMDELRERLDLASSAAATTKRNSTIDRAAGVAGNVEQYSGSILRPAVGAFGRVLDSPRSVSSCESDYQEAISTPDSKPFGISLTGHGKLSPPLSLPSHVNAADAGDEVLETVSPRAAGDGGSLGEDDHFANHDATISSPARVDAAEGGVEQPQTVSPRAAGDGGGLDGDGRFANRDANGESPAWVNVAVRGVEESRLVSPRAAGDGGGLGGDDRFADRTVHVSSPVRVHTADAGVEEPQMFSPRAAGDEGDLGGGDIFANRDATVSSPACVDAAEVCVEEPEIISPRAAGDGGVLGGGDLFSNRDANISSPARVDATDAGVKEPEMVSPRAAGDGRGLGGGDIFANRDASVSSPLRVDAVDGGVEELQIVSPRAAGDRGGLDGGDIFANRDANISLPARVDAADAGVEEPQMFSPRAAGDRGGLGGDGRFSNHDANVSSPARVDAADAGVEEPQMFSPRAAGDGGGLGGDGRFADRDANVSSPARVDATDAGTEGPQMFSLRAAGDGGGLGGDGRFGNRDANVSSPARVDATDAGIEGPQMFSLRAVGDEVGLGGDGRFANRDANVSSHARVGAADGGVEEPEIVSLTAAGDGGVLGGNGVLANRDVNVTSPRRVVHSPPSRVSASGEAGEATAFVHGEGDGIESDENCAGGGHGGIEESSGVVPLGSLPGDVEMMVDKPQGSSVETFSSDVEKYATGDSFDRFAAKPACTEEAEAEDVDNAVAIERTATIYQADGGDGVGVSQADEKDETDAFSSEKLKEWAAILATCENRGNAAQRVMDLSVAVTVMGEKEFLELENTKEGVEEILAKMGARPSGDEKTFRASFGETHLVASQELSRVP